MFSFFTIGILSKLVYGLLANVSMGLFWRKAKDKDTLFFVELAARVLVASIIMFFIVDVGLVDINRESIFSRFAFIVGLWLIIDSVRYVIWTNEENRSSNRRHWFEEEEKAEQIEKKEKILPGILVGLIGVSILLTWFFLAIVYPRVLITEKYESVQVNVLENPEEVADNAIMPLVDAVMVDTKGDAIISNPSFVPNPSLYSEGDYRLVKNGNQLVYSAAIEFDGYFKQKQAGSTKGFIEVDATNPSAPAKFVESELVYLKSNYFDENLTRVVRDAYPDKLILDEYLQSDDNGEGQMVIILGHYEKYRSITEVDGVVVLDPKKGEYEFFALGEEPDWVSRTHTVDVALERWNYFGRYKNGWWNQSLFGRKNEVIVPTNNSLQVTFNEDGDIIYVTDFVRARLEGESRTMVGFGTFNAKTGEMNYYAGTASVLTMQAALNAINTSEHLSLYQNWSAPFATLYTIYGQPTYVAPVLSSKFEGVAVVYAHSNNPRVVFGKTKAEAFRNYKRLLATVGDGNGEVPTSDFNFVTVEGTVTRIGDANYSNGYVFMLMLDNDTTLYSVNPEVFPHVTVTEKGDVIRLEVMDTKEEILSVESFQNNSLNKK